MISDPNSHKIAATVSLLFRNLHKIYRFYLKTNVPLTEIVEHFVYRHISDTDFSDIVKCVVSHDF